MENIAPLYAACLELRLSLQKGQSLHRTLQQLAQQSALSDGIRYLLAQNLSNTALEPHFLANLSFQRSAFFRLLERGLKGEPIYEALVVLEAEVKQQCEREVQDFLARLPYKSLLPVLLLQLPAYLYLFFSPLLNELLHHLQF